MKRRTPAASSHQSASSAFERARAAWAIADYDTVLDILAHQADGSSKLLLARTQLRLDRANDAMHTLKTLRPSDPDEAAWCEVLSSYARARRSGTHDGHVIRLSRAVSTATRAMVSYYHALGLWMGGQIDAAADAAATVASNREAAISALGTELLGFIEAERHRWPTAARRFMEVIDLLSQERPTDEYVRANSLHALSSIMVETLDLDLAPRIIEASNTLRQTGGIARVVMQTRVHVAVAQSLLGDEAACYQTLLTARMADVAPPFRALPDLALSAFHRRRGHLELAQFHLDIAQSNMAETDWGCSDLEARLVLVSFAAEAALIEPKRAGTALTKALSFTGRRDPLLAFEHDERAAFLALLARGRIAAHRGRTEDAMKDIEVAISGWRRTGYLYRAAVGSLDLARITMNTEALGPARTAVRHAPNSWLRNSAQAIEEELASPLSSLSPAELRVMEGICEGKTSRQIAADLERSPMTVRNQTISIFRKLGVTTRSALVAKVKAQ